ncbi:hypothetical protein [Pseudomonas sp. Marseille-QA0332]
MSEYVFEPQLSFVARCYWQFAEGALSQADLLGARGDLAKPIWVEFNDWNGDDGWLMSGRDYSPQELQSFLHDHLPLFGPRQRIYCEYLWFGVYRIGDLHAYEVRPAYAGANTARWPELEYVLDVSRGGYLGMYPTDNPAGSSPLARPASLEVDMPDPVPETRIDLPTDPPLEAEGLLFRYRKSLSSPIWTIEGLEPAGLASGDIRTGLQLYGPSGRVVRRLVENGRAYLNDRTGKRGHLGIQVLQSPVPPHPAARHRDPRR